MNQSYPGTGSVTKLDWKPDEDAAKPEAGEAKKQKPAKQDTPE